MKARGKVITCVSEPNRRERHKTSGKRPLNVCLNLTGDRGIMRVESVH
jgi:hypothetical protein